MLGHCDGSWVNGTAARAVNAALRTGHINVTSYASAPPQTGQGRSQGWPGWPKPPQSPLRKNIRQKKQLILSTTFTLHIKLYSELQWY